MEGDRRTRIRSPITAAGGAVQDRANPPRGAIADGRRPRLGSPGGAILRSEEVDLRKLAELGGFDAATLYAHSDFSGLDLRGQDLTGMKIGKLDRDKVIYDENTVWPDGSRGAP